VAHWEFDEGSGTTAFDSSGGGNTGTLVNGPVWTAGKFGTALQFDGVNDRVTIPDNDSLEGVSGITISAWINPNLTGGDSLQRIVDKVWDSAYVLYILNNGSIGAGMATKGSGSGYSSWSGGQFGKTVTANVWQHVVFVWDSTTAKANIYLNGVAGIAQARDGDRVGMSATPLSIGDRSSSDRSFSGSIDDVRIYSRALSTQEILSLYQSGGCLHKSDNNPCDGCVDNLELPAFIDRWEVNNLDVTLKELMEAIGLWKRGC